MKKLLYLGVLFILIQHTALMAQTVPQNFQTLQLNSSPAYVLLGVDPTNIQRPSTPSQFIAGLQNAVVNGKLQPNVAFEISPYYLKNPKDTTSKLFNPAEYLLNKKNFIQTIFQTLSISLATSSTDSITFGNLKSGTGIGIGVHFLLIDGTPSDKFKNWGDSYLKSLFFDKLSANVQVFNSANITDINIIIDHTYEVFQSKVLPAQNFNSLSDKEWADFISKLKSSMAYDLQSKGIGTAKAGIVGYIAILQKNANATLETTSAILSRGVNPLAKQGFMLEFDAGQAYVFQNNVYDNAALAKSAIWLSPSYRWDVSKNNQTVSLLDLMGVIRYTFNNTSAKVDVANYLDAGLKGAYTQNKWSGSLEFIYRHASAIPVGYNKAYTYRLTAGLNYKISDMLTFTFNFGSNFDGNTVTYNDPKKMFAIGGLNFGFPSFNSIKNPSAN
ncbi:MAG: hypothetical protein ABIN91_13965 [Mucilaginibacter sp.]|uniref:hypothetical protein n=1 Tax=Mucilaginibacter sp. TaxID=1882438 RepID=UPI0032665245